MHLLQHLKARFKQRLGVPSIPFAIEHLKEVGFQPKLIFDVGAYQGDFARCCLQTWPHAKIACFEALEHRVDQLQQMANQVPSVQVFPVLLGAKRQESVALHRAETASSILTEQTPQAFPISLHPMQTVDEVVREHFMGQEPDLLKLDVQGYELEVLKGSESSLPNVKVILAEVSLLDIHQDVPLLADLIVWFKEHNWVAYDICGLTRRPIDQALWQADFIFVPVDSPLRSDKRWSA